MSAGVRRRHHLPVTLSDRTALCLSSTKQQMASALRAQPHPGDHTHAAGVPGWLIVLTATASIFIISEDLPKSSSSIVMSHAFTHVTHVTYQTQGDLVMHALTSTIPALGVRRNLAQHLLKKRPLLMGGGGGAGGDSGLLHNSHSFHSSAPSLGGGTPGEWNHGECSF